MTTTQEQPTQEHLNKLIDFRQAIYESGLIRAYDAQFELLDALLLSSITWITIPLSKTEADDLQRKRETLFPDNTLRHTSSNSKLKIMNSKLNYPIGM